MAGAPEPGWQDAVEEVHAVGDALHQILRRADAHQVAGALRGQEARGERERPAHRVGGLADGEPAEGADDDEIHDDVDYLLKLWDQIIRKSNETRAPALIYADLDLVLRSVRDLLRDNISEMVVDSEEQYARARRFAGAFMPKYVERIKHYQGRQPIFDAFGIEEALRAA